MDLSEMTIQYHGFHPSVYTKDYLESVMDELYGESPHGSVFQAVFTRQGHTFKARVRIDSSTGHFFAVASGKKLKEVSHRVVFQIRKQLGKWKSTRYDHTSLKQIPYEFEGDEDLLSSGVNQNSEPQQESGGTEATT